MYNTISDKSIKMLNFSFNILVFVQEKPLKKEA